MPNKGYKQTKEHRNKIKERNLRLGMGQMRTYAET